MPEDLGEIPPATPENETIATVWIASKTLLNLQSQPLHATAHVSMTGRDPDSASHRNGDQDRSAVSTRRNAARFTSRPTRTCHPSPSSISIRSDRVFELLDDARFNSLVDDIGVIGVSKTCTGTNAGVPLSRKVPSCI